MIGLLYCCKAHDEEEEKDKKEHRDSDAAATAADPFLRPLGEPLVAFSAAGKDKTDQPAHQGTCKDKFQHSEQI